MLNPSKRKRGNKKARRRKARYRVKEFDEQAGMGFAKLFQSRMKPSPLFDGLSQHPHSHAGQGDNREERITGLLSPVRDAEEEAH